MLDAFYARALKALETTASGGAHLISSLLQINSCTLLPCSAIVLQGLPNICKLLLSGLLVDPAMMQLCSGGTAVCNVGAQIANPVGGGQS